MVDKPVQDFFYFYRKRFQRKAYANIEIVQTEKKGYGLRAQTNISKSVPGYSRLSTIPLITLLLRDDFIYEYIGDVVSQPSFAKRMREYAQEGIRHFYFMMLQKGEVCRSPYILIVFGS